MNVLFKKIVGTKVIF